MGGFDKKVGAILRNWEKGDRSKRRDYDYKRGLVTPLETMVYQVANFGHSNQLMLLWIYRDQVRGRGKHSFLGVYLKIKKKVFYSGAFLYEETESEEKKEKSHFWWFAGVFCMYCTVHQNFAKITNLPEFPSFKEIFKIVWVTW